MSKWIIWENTRNGKTGEMEMSRFMKMIRRPGFSGFGVVKEFTKKADFTPPEAKPEAKKENRETTKPKDDIK